MKALIARYSLLATACGLIFVSSPRAHEFMIEGIARIKIIHPGAWMVRVEKKLTVAEKARSQSGLGLFRRII
jgi:hypothetical protein